ncbi:MULTISPECIES: hypothetical protein [unclassified Oceanispirochaeta]|uniref:hypothetical protein n=1 Tax=unclassified Oceanispirochaeta TaxID=2635722 RepID=UPI000E09C405|nr:MULTISPECIES: hypothetical protein [unclassified Oceanispirochaeta]MBF9018332.1 hypothetical protein [Oceanispirochaeta sp. M2]NPD74797.1 hypothetical protein [Oceanispirochaeta sp. M1]RDG29350.1 hypothetical protein DV872_22095 [Oceanispirochaeta sp. M1]
MGALSFVLLPLAIRFILTPILLKKETKKRFEWSDKLSLERSQIMKPILKKRLMSSERMNPVGDIKAMLEVVAPPDSEGTVRLNFTALRFLEISLMAYEDAFRLQEKSRMLRYFLNRRIRWYRPFYRGYRVGQHINQFRIIRFLNRKGVFTQLLRLALVPLLGIPGILFYSIRSIFLRIFWEGFIRWFYLSFLFRASQYILYLYGGICPEIEERRAKFSKNEIIRKYRHYDRELTIMPSVEGREDVLRLMVEEYSRIMIQSGLTPDEKYNLRPDADKKRVKFKGRMSGFFRKTISAINSEFSSTQETVPIKDILIRMCETMPGLYYPGKETPHESYRINQMIAASYKLSIIALGAVYSNAPGSRIALEKVSVDLFRKVRDFSRQPLMTLLKSKGMDSWRSIRPVLKARQLLKLRKASPTAVAGLGFPLFGRILQDKGKEILLHRIGRALIRYTVLEEKEMPEP